MSALRGNSNDQDPDYSSPVENNEKHQKIYEENARSNTARKITAIVEKEFSQEIKAKEKEILDIQERLHRALKTLHLLRYVIITDFYNRKQCQAPQTGEAKQTQIHPAIKRLIGKSPKCTRYDSTLPSTSADLRFSGQAAPVAPASTPLSKPVDCSKSCADENPLEQPRAKRRAEDDEPRPKKVPRYVPPKNNIPEPPCPFRDLRHKVKKRIIIGNISKWIPPDWREDAASHKWTMYVRGSKDNADVETFVSKVRFFLHPSYRPNDVVEITSAPFYLSRRGWGEFPLRVQLHFKSPLNKPMDIIHHLKLDRTYTGLQTLGSETIVDLWIHASENRGLEYSDRINSKEPETRDDEEPATTNEASTLQENDPEVRREERSESPSKISAISTDNSPKVPATVDEEESFAARGLSNGSIELNTRGIKTEKDDAEFLGGPINESLPKYLEKLRLYVRLDHDYLAAEWLKDADRPSPNSAAVRVVPKDGIEEDGTWWTSKDGSFVSSEMLAKNNSADTDGPSRNRVPEAGNGRPSHAVKDDERSPSIWANSLKYEAEAGSRIEGPVEAASEGEGARPGASWKSGETSTELASNLQPLQISIPPPFEAAVNKRVVLLQNNKLVAISAEVSAGRRKEGQKDTKGGRPRSSDGIAPGTSILKRSIGARVSPARDPASNSEVSMVKLKPSGGIILNMNCNVPALKIAEPWASSLDRQEPAASRTIEPRPAKQETTQEERASRARITLGKDRLKVQSKRDCYQDAIKSLESVREKIPDVQGLLRFIVRRLPIVTQSASDPEYKRLHPYACSDEAEFFGYNLAKQRACEWFRAKAVHSFLRTKSSAEERPLAWTVKEILLWARLHGHTPVRAPFSVHATASSTGRKNLPGSSTPAALFTVSEPLEFHSWLQACPRRPRRCSSSEPDGPHSAEEINVLDFEEPDQPLRAGRSSRVGPADGGQSSGSGVLALELATRLEPLQDFVCETARQIGIKLVSEEIVPNVVHCAAGRMVMRALECFLEDLLRASLAKAWERCSGNGCPEAVGPDDIRHAIAAREDFDIFTNAGLGSKHRRTSAD
ncbi:hypothetical protein KM043_003314 [Ampulex compressa]|nr:hypothetical protein KM043_003314 [Ampulex compressa]